MPQWMIMLEMAMIKALLFLYDIELALDLMPTATGSTQT